MAVILPEAFTDRMQRQLGQEEYELFLQEFQKEGLRGLRINTEKISAADFCARVPFHLTRVPWTENGFYYEDQDPVTKHPYYYAGLYYVQEPSAMLPASRLPVSPGDLVLDLCAAPGGKATELASRLKGKGMLVANDVSATRAKALLKNLSVWGAANCCVTGETPEKLLQAFGCCFDRILVDAPCSGEGMFRRDGSLIQSWQERGPEEYAPLQKDILDTAVQMLRPGGDILYSTCTFSGEEDEQVIGWILEKYPELQMREIIPWYEGFCPGAAPAEKSVRVWPQRMKGEGHYLALLHKRADSGILKDSRIRLSREEAANSWKKAAPEVLDFLKRLPADFCEGRQYLQKGEQIYLLPPYRLPGRLRFLGTGLFLGTLKKGRFEPSQPLAMTLRSCEFDGAVDFSSDDPRVIRYLKGETIELTETDRELPDGWVLVCVDGFALGWGKHSRGTIKNKYCPGWRMQ